MPGKLDEGAAAPHLGTVVLRRVRGSFIGERACRFEGLGQVPSAWQASGSWDLGLESLGLLRVLGAKGLGFV